MGIYLNKWSGELQLEIKEGYHKFYNFVLHKGHNSEISKVKLIEIELDLPLVILNNISKFGFDLVDKGNNKITELRTILQRESQNS